MNVAFAANRNINESRWRFVVALIAFRIALDFSYYAYLSSAFRYHFLTPFSVNFDIYRFAASYLIIIFIASVVSVDRKEFSGIFFIVAFLFLFLPMTSIYGLDNTRQIQGVILVAVAILVAMMSAKLCEPAWRNFPLLARGRTLAVGVSILMSMYFIVWSIISGAIKYVNISLDDIYLFREASGRILDVGMFSYLNIWTQKAFNPFLVAYSAFNRRYALLSFSIFVQVFFFLVTQHRAHLFVPILIVLISYIYSKNYSMARLSIIASIGVVMATVVGVYTSLGELAAIVIRRAFYVPASVTFDWIAFFVERQKVYFSDRLLSQWIKTDYNNTILPYYIGEYYVPRQELAYNTGLVGAGYAQLGVWGVVLYAVIIGIMLGFLNAQIRKGLPVFLVAAVMITPIRTAWADSDLFTALLSHGIIVSALLLWLHGPDRTAERSDAR